MMANYKPKHLIYILPALIIVGGFFLLELKYNIAPILSDESTKITLPYFKKGAKSEETEKIERPYLTINGGIVSLEIADTPLKQVQGLSDREELCEDCGMLFVFRDKQMREFWMKNMNFPLDIIWIDDDRVAGISRDLAPEGEYPENIYSSEVPVNYVLEVNSGYTEKNKITINDIIEYNF